MTKKLCLCISFILFTCIIASPISVYAITSNNGTNNVSNTQKQAFNEYDLYKNKKKEVEQKVKARAALTESDKEVLKFDYKEEIRKRAKLNDSDLKKLGYSESDIEMLRNYDGSEAQTYALTAAVLIYSSTNSVSVKHAAVDFSWIWDKAPFYLNRDIIACAWVGISADGKTSTPMRINEEASYHYVKYCDKAINGSLPVDVEAPYWLKGPMETKDAYSAVSFTFGLQGSETPGRDYYAKNGYGRVVLNTINEGVISEVGMRFEYGHTPPRVTPGFSFAITSSFGVSIAFDKDISPEDWSYHVHPVPEGVPASL